VDLDWEEGVFRGLLSLGRRLGPTRNAVDARAASLADHHAPLTTLARVIAAEPVRVLPGREAGGVRGADLLLPPTLALAPDPARNRVLYRVRTAISAAVRRLSRVSAPELLPGADELASLRVAHGAVAWLSDELPGFATAWDEARRLEQAVRPDPASLRGRARLVEEARRDALAGERPWDDRERVRALQRARPRRGPASPGVLLWGEWIRELRPADDETHAAPEAAAPEVTTELPAPALEDLRRVEIDRQEQEDAVLIHTFEKTETLDEYRGGGRDADGSDSLEEHLDALEEVDLGALVRDDTPTRAALRLDLALELDVPDAAGDASAPLGIPYDEWDGRRGRYRRGWCTVYPVRETASASAGAAWARDALGRHRRLRRELLRRLERHRAGLRPALRQPDGDDVDIEALVDHQSAVRAGHGDDARLYVKARRRRRDFATTVLLDVSLSTDSWYEGRRVLDVSREAVLLLGEVAHELGDRLQVLAFASQTRNRCHVFHLKDWSEPWPRARARLGTLEPTGYTRIGPALRYATDCLAAEPAERRLLLLVSDGKPTDYDRYEGRYGIADVRQALREAERREIHAHALAVDAVARDALPPMFGPGAWHVLSHPDALPEALSSVYGRLTSR
jgi:nitric oxide reductase NorD protein